MARSDETVLEELCTRYDYDKNEFHDAETEGDKDMQYVGGDPWSTDDKAARRNRPMIAPEEMGQYKNQVINPLRKQPRGVRFTGNGNGASSRGAEFYQNKWREIEYRSQAKLAYLAMAENALDRSYGWLRIKRDYLGPRAPNQDLWIEAVPDPNMILVDIHELASRPDGSALTHLFSKSWVSRKDFIRDHKGAALRDFDQYAVRHPAWIQGGKILKAEYWTTETEKRILLEATPPALQAPNRLVAPQPPAPPKPMYLFADELEQARADQRVPLDSAILEVREVPYPTVWTYLTNGIEILSRQQWPGKYIPFVSCLGKVIYRSDGGVTKISLLSMTRFGREPWKAMCFIDSQGLEVFGQIPKVPVIVYKGQITPELALDWQESVHVPKVFLEVEAKTKATGEQILPPPERMSYTQAEHLQALAVWREIYRKAIQSAMASNFLPTQAQTHNEKSGIALDNLQDAADVGTYHFVDHYDDALRRAAMIGEDLLDKVHDYRGETMIMASPTESTSQPINDPGNPESVDTTGDYLCTISIEPSSNSEQEALEKFLDSFIAQIEPLAQLVGPELKKVIGMAVRARNGGAKLEEIADIFDPPPPQGPDGKPVPPEMQAAQTKIQQLTQQLQQLQQQAQAKAQEKQIEQQGKLAIVNTQEGHEDQRAQMDREMKLAIAEIAAQAKKDLQSMALFYEERGRLGAQLHEQAQGGRELQHDVAVAHVAAAHDTQAQAREHAHQHHVARQQREGAVHQALLAKQLEPPPDQQPTQ